MKESQSDPQHEGEPRTGLRERKMAQKRERITMSARELFAEKGYDDVTPSELAQRAGVGVHAGPRHTAARRDRGAAVGRGGPDRRRIGDRGRTPGRSGAHGCHRTAARAAGRVRVSDQQGPAARHPPPT